MTMLLEEPDEALDTQHLPPDALYEVIDGQVVEIQPMGAKANLFAFEFAFHLRANRSSPRDLVTTETLFILPDPVARRRRPDLAYLRAERIPATWPPPVSEDPPAIDAVPNLAVEVVSPTDKAYDIEERRRDYLRAGVTLLVVVYPNTRTIYVYRSPNEVRILTEGDTLDLGAAVPGFSIPVAELFAPFNRPT